MEIQKGIAITLIGTAMLVWGHNITKAAAPLQCFSHCILVLPRTLDEDVDVQYPISPTAIPTRVHRIWRGHNIPANAYKHYYNVQIIKSFTHPVMRKGPKSIGESHSAASLATWTSIAPPHKNMATQLESRGLWGSLTKITPSPCLAPSPIGRRT